LNKNNFKEFKEFVNGPTSGEVAFNESYLKRLQELHEQGVLISKLDAACMGFPGELAEMREVWSQLKEDLSIRQLDFRAKMTDELGDLYWYLVHLMEALDFPYESYDACVHGKKRNPKNPMIHEIDLCFEQLTICIGKMTDQWKKTKFQGRDWKVTKPKMIYWLTQILREFHQLHIRLRITPLNAVYANKEKLSTRYPDGFSVERANNRIV